MAWITSPFQNFNGCTAEVWEWIKNFIPHFTMDHYLPMMGLSWTMSVKEAPESRNIYQYKLLKSFFIYNKRPVDNTLYNACRWPGGARSQDINSYVIGKFAWNILDLRKAKILYVGKYGWLSTDNILNSFHTNALYFYVHFIKLIAQWSFEINQYCSRRCLGTEQAIGHYHTKLGAILLRLISINRSL